VPPVLQIAMRQPAVHRLVAHSKTNVELHS
jgi:hypothetical protein